MVKRRALPFAVEHTGRNVATVRLSVTAPQNQWEQWFLLSSDRHHDNPKCDQRLEKRHLDEAVERRAGIIDAGDLFCAMQGKWDKRADKSCVREEHQHGDYLDRLVGTAAEFYGPYAHHWIVMGRGNHETAVRKAHETDLTDRLVDRLNSQNGSRIQAGGYGGWVRFLVNRGNQRVSRTLYYYHGSGGGGPVTKGVIQTNRLATWNPDADIVLTGHTHDDWIFPIPRQRLSGQGVPFRDEQLYIRPPGYKDAWADGYDGYEVERMHGPKNTGAIWLRFFWRDNKLEVDAQRAK